MRIAISTRALALVMVYFHLATGAPVVSTTTVTDAAKPTHVGDTVDSLRAAIAEYYRTHKLSNLSTATAHPTIKTPDTKPMLAPRRIPTMPGAPKPPRPHKTQAKDALTTIYSIENQAPSPEPTAQIDNRPIGATDIIITNWPTNANPNTWPSPTQAPSPATSPPSPPPASTHGHLVAPPVDPQNTLQCFDAAELQTISTADREHCDGWIESFMRDEQVYWARSLLPAYCAPQDDGELWDFSFLDVPKCKDLLRPLNAVEKTLWAQGMLPDECWNRFNGGNIPEEQRVATKEKCRAFRQNLQMYDTSIVWTLD